MNRSPIKIKKHLNFTSLRQSFSDHLLTIDDPRRKASCTHSLHDAFMSGFACMFFQEPSLMQFQRSMEEYQNENNLRNLFSVQTIPKDTQMRSVIDNTDSEHLRPVFKQFFEQLRRGKHLESFQIIPRKYLCAIDGVYHHSSENISCEKCLTKTHKNGSVTHSHGVLQGAFMHPDKKQVIPVMPEPIANSDGELKQDCETKAAKRFMAKLKTDHPRMGIIIVGDGLFSKGPMIAAVLEEKMNFIFVAKPDDHQFMMAHLDGIECLHETERKDAKGRTHKYTYMNDIPLSGQDDAPLVNYIRYEIANEKGKVTYRNSWVTDIAVNDMNVECLAKGGRCRWKIENECFNTLKNQGYHLEHNFGHGKKNLSHNMYLLTLLAFFFHQIFELTDLSYQLCRKAFGSKRNLWDKFRALVDIFVFSNWHTLMHKLMSLRKDTRSFLKS